MAFETGWIVFGITALVFILIVTVYILWGKNIEARNRLKYIRAYKALPQKTAGAPVLLHGTAGSKRVLLPAGGDPVAFHATFIMSKGCTLLVGGDGKRPLPVRSSFRVFVSSGDFTVTESGIPYRVSILSALERMNMGVEYFTEKNKQNFVLDGIPEMVFDDMVQSIAGIQALEPVLDIVENGKSVTSTIDTRVRSFTQDRDVPPAIADLLKQKLIRPQPGEEITVIEFFIPEKKSVWVFGEFDGTNTVRYGEGNGGLYVSYADPDSAGAHQ